MGAIEATGWSRFVDLFRGDMEAVREVAQVFLDESEEQEATIRQAIEEGDAQTLRRVAHSLQSTARQLGAMELASLAATLEGAGKQGDMGTARTEAPHFFEVLHAVRADLRERL